MKTINFKTLSLFPLGIIAFANLGIGQDVEETRTNFIREYVSWEVVEEFASSPNKWEVDATGTGRFENGISAEEFLADLQTAIIEGRGGVIDFENPVVGPLFSATDRRGHRAIIEQWILDHPIEAYIAQAKEDNPGISDGDAFLVAKTRQFEDGYAEAEASLVSPEEIYFQARSDRGLNDTVDNALSEKTRFKDFIAFYGENRLTPLRFSRGPYTQVEAGGGVATRNYPLSTDLPSLINGQSFVDSGTSSYDGGDYLPTSGVSTLNYGMLDYFIAKGDNVTSLGFVVINYGNFQYYQGEGAPDNVDNIRVYVEYTDENSNITSDLLTGTTRQATGTNDVFFGIEAPEGSSITRVWLRVVGKNARTFVSIDDLAFITEPALPYIASGLEQSGSVGAEIVYQLLIGQNAESIEVTDLPSGLSFDSESGLITGIPDVAGEYDVTVTTSNSVGTNVETIHFSIAAEVSPENIVVVNDVSPQAVVLYRSLSGLTIESNLDATAQPGELTYTPVVYRILENGGRQLTSLNNLGLSITDNVISGTPNSASQIGQYEITVYVSNQYGADSVTFPFEILAPTIFPNFDGNATSDFLFVNNGAAYIARNIESDTFVSVEPTLAVSGLHADSKIYIGDFNGDINADILEWNRNLGEVRVHYSQSESSEFNTVTLFDGIDTASGETVLSVGDYNGDAIDDLLWMNENTGAISAWLMGASGISWGGYLTEVNLSNGTYQFSADVAGGGGQYLLWKTEEGYSLEHATSFGNLGKAPVESFSYETDGSLTPVFATDLDADGNQDLLWYNQETGAVEAWLMTSLAEPTIVNIFPTGFDWRLIAAADLNNDQKADYVLRNQFSGRLGIMLMNGVSAISNIKYIGTSEEEVLSLGDFNGDANNDVLVRNSVTGATRIISLANDGSIRSNNFISSMATSQWLTAAPINDAQPDSNYDYSAFWLTYTGQKWVYVYGFGNLLRIAVNDDFSGWYYDLKLGYVYIDPEYFPYIYQAKSSFWLYYYNTGDLNLRWFYNAVFGMWMTEDDPFLQ